MTDFTTPEYGAMSDEELVALAKKVHYIPGVELNNIIVEL